MELSSKPSKSFLVADRVFVATYTLESMEFVRSILITLTALKNLILLQLKNHVKQTRG